FYRSKVELNDDIETINSELILADLETITKRNQHVKKLARQKEKEAVQELAILDKIKDALESETPVRALEFSDEQARIVKGMHLLTAKPTLYVANVSEEEVGDGENNPLDRKSVV